MSGKPPVLWLHEVSNDDVAIVGGKNASLGEMIGALAGIGIQVPEGFAVTAEAYRAFVRANDLEGEISDRLGNLDGDALAEAGKAIREAFLAATLPDDLAEAVRRAYSEISGSGSAAEVAVRSSATAEDLPEASFAGQQDTYLNVRGGDAVLEAIKSCFASLFTDRAIAYREEHGFDHLDVALSVGVQRMVRSDKAGAGVMFTLDPETGFPRAVVIEAAWGLGEAVVAGTTNPDTYTVFKPLLDQSGIVPIIGRELGAKATKVVYARKGETETRDTPEKERGRFVLSDDEVLQLARWGVAIEEHYGHAMDIEWAKDGRTGELFIVQARPETVHSAQRPGFRTYRLRERGDVLVRGLAIGDAIAAGQAIRVDDPSQGERFEDGAILVTEMTDPDWVPLMRRAAAIVTDHGGRTAHAAIVSRELGIPAVIGAGDATSVLAEPRDVTVSCAEDDEGRVYEGLLDFDEREIDLDNLPEPRTRVMLNIASTLAAFRWWRLPAKGIGLARMEFVINNGIQIHPLALTRFDELDDSGARERIEEMTRGYSDRTEYFVDRLARSIATIAASQHPHPVIVRMSDFKTNEYADLIGGRQFEPEEANPMLGFRGACRYYSDRYSDGFALECAAIQRARSKIGLRNIKIMIPFVRTLAEADKVLGALAGNGLVRGQGGLEVYMMVEIPANVVLAREFAERFDGFSIGSNDLTQLVLGIDRDSRELAPLFDERDEAVKRMVRDLISTAHAAGIPVGICGQAPSDHPDYAAFLAEAGIDSMSLNPDSVVDAITQLAEIEA
ncbi:MAG: phosphoenolpyruvate synthase [Egibacteraceae bacterium]